MEKKKNQRKKLPIKIGYEGIKNVRQAFTNCQIRARPGLGQRSITVSLRRYFILEGDTRPSTNRTRGHDP